jgi:TetR/AcrR family transcriptional repressor of nem operon
MKSREETCMATKSTRDHLIDVGVGLMHQNGYNATGLTDILKAADAPKGSFITISVSKEDFAAAALYGQKGAIPGCMMGRFSLEIAGESPQLRKRISASFDHWQHTIAAVIGQAITQKELPAGTDSEFLAGFVLNSWEGALLRSQVEKSDASLEGFMHFVFDELLAKQSKAKAGGKPLENR